MFSNSFWFSALFCSFTQFCAHSSQQYFVIQSGWNIYYKRFILNLGLREREKSDMNKKYPFSFCASVKMVEMVAMVWKKVKHNYPIFWLWQRLISEKALILYVMYLFFVATSTFTSTPSHLARLTKKCTSNKLDMKFSFHFLISNGFKIVRCFVLLCSK